MPKAIPCGSGGTMEVQLYDTLERRLGQVVPMDGDTYRFYCCGPTVYGPAHIGNFRTFVVQDTFRRVAELAGITTCHVRNITDVDDKTIRQSQAEGKTLKSFTDFWVEKFHQDAESLNLLIPHHELSAVDHIKEQIDLIRILMDKGHAYQAPDGSIFFKVDSLPQYGKLSHLDEREIT
ncbi:MAG: cysteine--tRNA ligase, partial [Verrucomicrobiota bacterium]